MSSAPLIPKRESSRFTPTISGYSHNAGASGPRVVLGACAQDFRVARPSPVNQFGQRPQHGLAQQRETILDAWWLRREHVPGDHAVALKLAQRLLSMRLEISGSARLIAPNRKGPVARATRISVVHFDAM